MSLLKEEDYIEPRCPFCNKKTGKMLHSIDIERAVRRLDEYLGKNDYASAERHIVFWIGEARECSDKIGELAMQNELMGLQRKCGNEDKAREAAKKALELVKELDISDTVTAATSYINAATVEKAFGAPESAIQLYSDANKIYVKKLPAYDERLGGLYNNYALALAEIKKYREARAYYDMALEVMKNNPGKEPEQAITYLNIADTVAAEKGMESGADEIQKCLECAENLLETPDLPHDGNYAFVCEKCAPSFDYYGFFFFAAELRRRMKEIYERT